MSKPKTWAETARPIVAAVIAEHGGDPKALRRALIEAYPFGQRRYWPYKAWCAEVRRQLGKGKGRFPVGTKKAVIAAATNPNQSELFT